MIKLKKARGRGKYFSSYLGEDIELLLHSEKHLFRCAVIRICPHYFVLVTPRHGALRKICRLGLLTALCTSKYSPRIKRHRSPLQQKFNAYVDSGSSLASLISNYSGCRKDQHFFPPHGFAALHPTENLSLLGDKEKRLIV